MLARFQGPLAVPGQAVRKAPGGDDREERQAREGQKAELERPQARRLVELLGLTGLLVGGGRARQDLEQPLVADEIDLVEVQLRLELGGDGVSRPHRA